MIQAIETKYNGYRFRSRLEARWAVFFDALEIKYEYEPEGFDLSNIEQKHELDPRKHLTSSKKDMWYLPDFYLPEYRYYVEVKPDIRADFKGFCKAVLFGFEKPTMIIDGSPGHGSYSVTDLSHCNKSIPYVFALGRMCDRLYLTWCEQEQIRPVNCTECWSPRCGDRQTWDHMGMGRAYEAARSARF